MGFAKLCNLELLSCSLKRCFKRDPVKDPLRDALVVISIEVGFQGTVMLMGISIIKDYPITSFLS